MPNLFALPHPPGIYKYHHSGVSITGWQPFPPSDPSCGADYITGMGGEIVTPGYPNPYQPNIECTWMIRVEEGMRILLNFIDLDLGQKGERNFFEEEL